jgi:hypothetical protein
VEEVAPSRAPRPHAKAMPRIAPRRGRGRATRAGAVRRGCASAREREGGRAGLRKEKGEVGERGKRAHRAGRGEGVNGTGAERGRTEEEDELRKGEGDRARGEREGFGGRGG